MSYKYQNESTVRVVTQQQTSSSSKHLGTIEDKDFVVVQRTRGLEKSEAERQHHFEELVQDNLRMREVLEQLQREVSMYKMNSSTDVISLRKELLATQQELEAAQRQILALKQESESKTNAELERLRQQLEEFRLKYLALEEKDKANAEALKKLAYYQHRCTEFEQKAKQNYEKLSSVGQVELKFQEQLKITQSLEAEIERWMQKYDALMLQFKEMQSSSSNKDKILALERDIEALLQEIENWKARYRALELKFEEQSSNKQYELMLEGYKQALLDKEDQLKQTQRSIKQHGQSQQSQLQQQMSQMQGDYEARLRQLQDQLDQANRKLGDSEREMDSLKLHGTVYSQERFDEMQEEIWKYQLQIEQLEKDCDIFMSQIKVLEMQVSELTIKFDSQNADYLSMKAMVDSNSSKYKTVSNLEKEISSLQAELEVWKNRYFQTEIRLKEYDKLKAEYEALLLKTRTSQYQSSVTTTTEITTLKSKYESELSALRGQYEGEISRLRLEVERYRSQLSEAERNQRSLSRSSVYDSQWKSEKENLLRQISELELKLRQMQLELDDVIRNKNSQISSLESQISQYETRIQNIQSTTTRTVIKEVDETKIRELNDIIRLKNKQIADLESALNEGSSNQTIIIKEQVRTKEVRIRELEAHIETLQLEIQRLQNIRKDQENRIQVMIQKITEYESQLAILKEQNMRLSRGRSPVVYETKTVSNPIIFESKTITTQGPYEQKSVTTKQQSGTFVINKPSSSIITETVVVEQQGQGPVTKLQDSKYATRNIYPQEHENSEIIDRIESRREEVVQSRTGTSKYISTTNTAVQQPHIIVSQYRPQQL